MYYNGDIRFKNKSSKDLSLIVTTPPQVNHSDQKSNDFEIPGRDGELIGEDTYRGNAEIEVSFALVTKDEFTDNDQKLSKYRQAYRKVIQWLQGSGKLVIGDGQDSYYEVLKTNIRSDQRIVLHAGNIDVNFMVYPYEFLNSGNTAISGGGTITNEHDPSKPLYKITGNGDGVLTVNGKTISFTVNGTLYIDTRREFSYNGSNVGQDSNISGDYKAVRLKHGDNSVSITSGFTLETYPRWGYVI